MHDIDFLPIEYRQKHEQLQSQPWQVVAVAAIIGLVAAAAIVQHYHWHHVQEELAIIAPVYDTATNLQNRLTDVTKRLDRNRANEELYTYLRHPWPRSQLLTALLKTLPDVVTLEQIQISREMPTTPLQAVAQPSIDRKAKEARFNSLAPAQRDLEKFREGLDPMKTMVILTGTTAESSALHRYIGDLDAMDIFEDAELDSFNRVANGESGKAIQFRVVLAVQPGYGQPHGPTGEDTKVVAATSPQKP